MVAGGQLPAGSEPGAAAHPLLAGEYGRIMLVIVVEANTPVPTHWTPLQYSGILLAATIQK
jgi:hypothetical protein